jgi:hypothetical protein
VDADDARTGPKGLWLVVYSVVELGVTLQCLTTLDDQKLMTDSEANTDNKGTVLEAKEDTPSKLLDMPRSSSNGDRSD